MKKLCMLLLILPLGQSKRIVRQFVALLFIFLFVGFLGAQTSEGFKNNQWLQYYQSIRLSNKFRIKSDFGYRWNDQFKNRTQYLARVGLGYKLNKNRILFLGFANFGAFANDTLSKLEYRPYQEFVIGNRSSRFKFNHRVRLEERFFSQVKTRENYFSLRFRYRFYIQHPILHKTMKDKLFINLGDEIFVNLGSNVEFRTFGQNRFLIGSSYQITENVSFSFNYVKEIAPIKSNSSWKNINIFWLGLKHKVL